MFETTVVRARAADRHYLLLPFSIAMHSVAIAAVIAASLASIRLPDQAPKQMSRVYFAAPLTLPPALGTPAPASPKPRPAATAVAPAAPIPTTAPAVIPSTIAPVEPIGDDPSNHPSTIGVPWGLKIGVKPDGPPVPADSAGPLPVGNGVTAPVAIRRVEPIYPPLAVRARMSGSVLVQCIIDKSGRIRDVHVVSSTFSAFEQPAIDAVQQWLFAPGTLKGEPVDTIFELTVKFQVK